MNKVLINNVIKKHCNSVKKYIFSNDAIIYEDSNNNKFVAKRNKDANIINIYNYLNSRGFDYIPKLVYYNHYGYIYEYLEDINSPDEEKISDIIKLISLLHNKTVYYKEVSVDEIKEIYENLSFKIKNIYDYYENIISMIESKIYMSPSEYMLVRNCSSIFFCINFCSKTLDAWFEKVKNKTKKRQVLLHNNLSLNHIIKNKENRLISWNYSLRDLPIYDFIKLYKNNYNKYDFSELFKEYNNMFPLLEEEKMLLFVILFLPKKLEFTNNELLNTKNVCELCNYLYNTDNLFMENEAKNSEK